MTARLPRSAREIFRPPPDYYLEVCGASMDRLGFRTGTLIAVKVQQPAVKGDVVLASLDEEDTRSMAPSQTRPWLNPVFSTCLAQHPVPDHGGGAATGPRCWAPSYN